MSQHQLWNILRLAVKPYALPVLLGKLRRRVRDPGGSLRAAKNKEWIESHVEEVAHWARKRDPVLFEESCAFGEEFGASATRVLNGIPHQLAGGGHYVLLYFLVRLLRPEFIIETGVAAGYSSSALLAAADVNGSGRLYSSDFPAFRRPQAERYTGVLVPEALRGRWDLRTEGDKKNLQGFMREVPRVDLLHYDSDKTYGGRSSAMQLLAPRLSRGSVIVMDDIQDNSFFHDWLAREGLTDFWIFEHNGKYLGVAGHRLRA